MDKLIEPQDAFLLTTTQLYPRESLKDKLYKKFKSPVARDIAYRILGIKVGKGRHSRM